LNELEQRRTTLLSELADCETGDARIVAALLQARISSKQGWKSADSLATGVGGITPATNPNY